MPSTSTLSSAPITGDDVREMLRHIAPRPDYDRWTHIIAAVGDALPLIEAAQVLNEWSPEERRGEYAEKLRHRLPNVGIGTLVHLAKEGGYDAKEATRRRNGGAAGEAYRLRFGGKASATKSALPPLQSTQAHPTATGGGNTAPAPSIHAKAIKWPKDMHAGDGNELYTLADVRRIPGLAGLEAATIAGHLYFASMPDANGIEGADATGWVRGGRLAWLLTDSARRICLARRLDGEPWCHTQQKAWMRKGSDGAWPIGAPDIGEAHTVGLTEGGPDFLCLWHLIATETAAGWAPVGMPSACDISPDALHYFRGKVVLIFPHADGASGAGQNACRKWARQLREAGVASVRFFDFARFYDTSAMRVPKDLNDYIAAAATGTLVDACAADKPQPAQRSTGTSDGGNGTPSARPAPPQQKTASVAGVFCPQCRERNIIAVIGGPTCPHIRRTSRLSHENIASSRPVQRGQIS